MTEHSADSIVRWAERQADTKPQGRAGHLSPEQKTAIRLAYLESGGTLTYVALGRQFNVNRETVSAVLKGPEFDKLRGEIETEAKATAVQRLKAAVVPAADAWVRAVDEAADKGDHKPAKDLLMHTGTIEPLDDDGRARGPLVLFLVNGADGRQRYSDGTRTFDIDQETGEVQGLPRNQDFIGIGVALPMIHVEGVNQPPRGEGGE